ncbi:MAG: glucose 1-dehydrogenase [Lentisphaeria bacterium]|jgi:NAD(P)-dependent dehydrogenase (short-subunit alcohol dehydrogenase family)|nr:glucose 1-dehydrogenase [Lentisphaeria bacterium]
MRLADKVVLVTGGGRGLGKGLVRELGRQGADIALTCHASVDGASEVVGELQQLGRRAVAIQADLTQVADARRAVAETLEAFGRLDVLVYNSGVDNPHPFLEISEADYDYVLDLNLKGAFFCAQEAARAMIAQGDGGAIVTISSIHGCLSLPKHAHYAASKAGMNQFVRTVANELGPYGITVNAVSPAMMHLEEYLANPDYDPDEWDPTVPLGRSGYPRDIAAAVTFLASSDASYITGTLIEVDGGLRTRSPHYGPNEATTYPNLRGGG